jgi:two-component system, cell cycle sensor histidine kinase and response regulator CckA
MMVTGLVPLIIVLVPLATVLQRNLQIKEEEKLAETARQLGRLIAEVTDRTARELASLQSNPLLADPSGPLDSKLAEMHRLVKIYEVYSDISLYDNEGFLLGSTAKEHPAFRDYSDWFREALSGKIALSQPQRVLGREGLYMTVFLPVKPVDANEKVSASQVLKARLSFGRIMSLLEDGQIGVDGSVYLLDALGNTLSGRDPSRLMEKFDPSLSADRWVSDPIGNYRSPEGKEFLYATEVLPGSVTKLSSHWVVIALKPMEEVTAMMRQSILTLFAAAACMMLVASVLGIYLSKRMSRPLEKIGEVAREVARGNLEVRADHNEGASEARDLALLFNRMIAELSQHREGLERLVESRTESLNISQSELERAGARLQAAIESTNNGFLVEDTNGNVAVVNDLFLSLLGIDSEKYVPGKAAGIIGFFESSGGITKEIAGEWTARRGANDRIDCEVTLELPARRVLHVYSAPVNDSRGNLVGRVWNTQDLTAQRQLEEGLRQSQKMEAVGQLAGGIAHDFNNLLAGILGNLTLVQMDLGPTLSSEGRESLSHAVKAGERAVELVRQLLGFSRRSRMDLKPCDANLVLAEVRDILAATIDRRIGIVLDLEDCPWRAMADVGMLGQVIMNMSVNAKDAMSGGGHLFLRSSNRILTAADLHSHPEIAPGDFICLSVEDEGEGIPLEIQSKIFEPFFTTKEPGKGTGLGLATSFGIVKQLGGWIDFKSAPGKGTCFDIYLPRSTSAEAGNASALIAAPVNHELAPSRKGETILLVDDEALVRRIGRTLLSRLGYEILEAADGLEALEICRKQGESISLVLLDLTMPNLSGKETFAGLREMRPDLPVLICSGYLVDLDEFTRECGACPDGFVQKPYSFEDMSAIVRKTLDQQSAAAA